MRKKRRVPEVLWRLFKHRTQTLAHTIISLISQSPPSNCRCKGRRCCLKCCGEENAMSFLLQPDDPSDYRKLLNNCFVVVNDNAPPLSHFYPDNHWPQHQVVGRTIEMIMFEQPKSSNTICIGYDKCNQSSPIVELLTCSSWGLLLKRVGDDVMVYLLKHTSIFLPLSHKKHYQVTGLSISDLCFKLPKPTAEPQYQHPSLVRFGPQKKRKIVDDVSSMSERQHAHSSVSFCGKSSSLGCVGCNGKGYVRSFNRKPGHNHGDTSFFGAATLTTDAVAAKREGVSDGELQQSSNQVAAKPRKRSRPFSWQRRRNRRKINFQEHCDITTRPTICTDKDNLCGGLQCDFNNRMQEKCPCCLILEAPMLVTKSDHIDRGSMFYSLEFSSTVFPPNHILNSLKSSFDDSKSLIQSIFCLSDISLSALSMLCPHSSGFCLIGSACLFHSLANLLKILIRRSRCCQYLRLLDKHCAVPSLDEKETGNSSSLFEGNELGNKVYEKSHGSSTKYCNKTPEAGDSQSELVEHYCSKSQVVSFIWAVCRSIIPADLLGTPFNWRVLRRNISKFVQLRRFEKFSIKQCMHKLKSSMFPFLSNKHSSCNFSAMHNIKQKLLRNWIFWFFSCLVVPLVQANFYVTESEHGKQDIYYYRKSIWKKLTNRSMTCLKDKSYRHIDAAAVRSVIRNRSFGFSKLRLRPKENGVRMLANLKASSRMPAQRSLLKDTSCGNQTYARVHHKIVQFEHFKSVNFALRDTHAVMKGLLAKEPEKLGYSVFNYNDVYRKLCPFLIGLRNGSPTIPGVFIVGADVAKAFDSIDQDKLLSVMHDVIPKDEYLFELSHNVVCTKRSLWVHENLTLTDQNVSLCRTRSTSSITLHSFHGILVNKGRSRRVRKEELFFILKEHVKRNVLQLDKKFYLQGIGIPQGSVLSSMLCSLYYGHLDRNVIYPFLEKTRESAIEVLSGSNSVQNKEDTIILSPSYMLLRFIDDFLFISTSKEQAANFFHRLQRGFRDYNCYMNEEKFSANFDIRQKSGLPSNKVYVGDDGISFLRWSGLFINCSTLEVQGDYTRYLNNHLSSTLTVCWEGKPGHQVKKKLCSFMRPKCHPVFFDSNINSAAVVRLNIYQSFLLSAMKFHCYVSDLWYICKLCTGSYLKIIKKSLRYMDALIKKRMHSMHLGSDLSPILQLEKGEVEWLGLKAFVKVLKRKQSRYKELLSRLRIKLLAHRITRKVPCELKYAVDRSHSSAIWKIKY